MPLPKNNSVPLCWIDRLNSLVPHLHPIFFALLVGFAIYLLACLSLLFTGHFRMVFDLPLLLGIVGIVWSVLFYLYGSQNYLEHLELFETAVQAKSIEEYRKLKSDHITRLDNDRSHFVVAILVWIAFAVLITADFYEKLPTKLSGSLRVFPPAWYDPAVRLYVLPTIIVVGLAVALLVWTLGRLIILHTIFLGHASHLPFVASQHVCLVRFRSLLRINMLAAFGWSVGVAFFGVLFRHTHRPAQIAFMGLLGTVATAAFFWPIWSFEANLRKIGLNRVNSLVAAVLAEIKRVPDDPRRWTDLFMLENQLSSHVRDASFALMRTYVGTLLTTFIIPVLAAAIGAIAATFFQPAAPK
jgi:hypothetical protein